MVRRFVALFALFMLTLVSAAFAHGHDMRHVASRPGETIRQWPIALPPATSAMDHADSWFSAKDPGICSGVARSACHNQKMNSCTCPAACAGLFNVAAQAQSLSAETATAFVRDTEPLSAMSSAPPTPPPRA